MEVHENADCLTCAHHSRQLWSPHESLEHVTTVQNFHKDEVPTIEELVHVAVSERKDVGADPGENLLRRFYGAGAVVMRNMAWTGGGLGREGAGILLPKMSMPDAARQQQFFRTMARTLRPQEVSLSDRWPRDSIACGISA